MNDEERAAVIQAAEKLKEAGGDPVGILRVAVEFWALRWAPVGFLEDAVIAETEFLATVGGHRPDGLEMDAAAVRHLRENQYAIEAPSVFRHIAILRTLLAQGGDSYKEEENNPDALIRRLGTLADAVALRPTSGPRGGKPQLAPALTKHFRGLPKMRADLKEIIHDAYFRARKEKGLVDAKGMFEWFKDQCDLLERWESATRHESRGRWLRERLYPGAFNPPEGVTPQSRLEAGSELTSAVNWLRTGRYAVQREHAVADYFAKCYAIGMGGAVDLASETAKRKLRAYQPRAKRSTSTRR
jgi:hypothetical protein